MFPLFNPFIEKSSGFFEDDYILVKVLGESYDPKSIKNKLVRVIEPDGSKVIRRVECVEGEWCANSVGFTFIQSGHAWVTRLESAGYTVIFKKVPLALIDGTVEAIIWPPDRRQFIQNT